MWLSSSKALSKLAYEASLFFLQIKSNLIRLEFVSRTKSLNLVAALGKIDFIANNATHFATLCGAA